MNLLEFDYIMNSNDGWLVHLSITDSLKFQVNRHFCVWKANGLGPLKSRFVYIKMLSDKFHNYAFVNPAVSSIAAHIFGFFVCIRTFDWLITSIQSLWHRKGMWQWFRHVAACICIAERINFYSHNRHGKGFAFERRWVRLRKSPRTEWDE